MDFNLLKKNYDENGFVTIEEKYFKNDKIFDELKKYFAENFLKYNDNKTYKDLKIDHKSPEFKLNNIVYKGFSKDQILFRNQKNNLDNANCLFGKRGVLDVLNIDNYVARVIENNKILNLAKKFLNEEEIIFLNGSFATSYPGNLGEGKRFHCDITAFNNGKTIDEIIESKKHVCNIMIYLSDVDYDNAPMRVLPNSHKKYKDINKLVSNSTKVPLEKSYIPQAHIAFDEILEDTNFKTLEGKEGTIIAMNSFCIHSATENFSKDKIRNVIILNYGPKNFGFYKRNMKQVEKQKFYKFINQKNLFDYNTQDIKRKKQNLGKIKRNILKFSFDLIKLNFIRSKLSDFKINLIKKLYKNKKKECLNIGAGEGWYHPNYITIDAKKNKNINESIVHNLVKNPTLPFNDNSFSAIYSSHCLEHLLEKDLLFTLHECKRILKSGGVLRITVPNIRLFFEAYDKRDMNFFNWMKDSEYYKCDSWLRLISRVVFEPVINYLSDEELKSEYEKSINYNQFCNFLIEKAKELKLEERNSKNYFPDNHKNYFDEERMEGYLSQIGFKNIKISKSKESQYTYFQNTRLLKDCFDTTRPHMSLYVECIKD